MSIDLTFSENHYGQAAIKTDPGMFKYVYFTLITREASGPSRPSEEEKEFCRINNVSVIYS